MVVGGRWEVGRRERDQTGNGTFPQETDWTLHVEVFFPWVGGCPAPSAAGKISGQRTRAALVSS